MQNLSDPLSSYAGRRVFNMHKRDGIQLLRYYISSTGFVILALHNKFATLFPLLVIRYFANGVSLTITGTSYA